MQGRAEIDQTVGLATNVSAMLQKYEAAIERIGYTPEQFAQGYSVAIRVTPTKLTAF